MSRGRVYRTCTCRGEDGRQLGASCPELTTNTKHGRWAYAVDLPSLDGRRKTMRRRGFPTKSSAQKALDDVAQRRGGGVRVDDRETVAAYLEEWLHGMRHKLKPSTLRSYQAYVSNDLVPTLGAYRLEHLTHRHVAQLITDMENAGRGAPTIRRCIAVLSSALADAVERHRLPHNVARHAPLPPEGRAERRPWTVEQAIRFLAHVRDHVLGPLFEVLIGTGLRRGEALALRWSDLDLDSRVLQVRQTLSDVNGKLIITKPKTAGSAAGSACRPAWSTRCAVSAHSRTSRGRCGATPTTPRAWTSCSPARTARRCVPRRCCGTSTSAPTRSGSRGARCTTCGTSPRR